MPSTTPIRVRWGEKRLRLVEAMRGPFEQRRKREEKTTAGEALTLERFRCHRLG